MQSTEPARRTKRRPRKRSLWKQRGTTIEGVVSEDYPQIQKHVTQTPENGRSRQQVIVSVFSWNLEVSILGCTSTVTGSLVIADNAK